MNRRTLLISIISLLLAACSEEYRQPYSEVVPGSESGLSGTWKGLSMEKQYALQLKDSLGNTIVDEKLRPDWKDTVEYLDYLNEALYFSAGDVDSFAISTHVDSLLAGVLLETGNMPLNSGHWSVIQTINPEGEKPDVSSVMFYNPADPHNSKQNILWSIVSQSADQITLSYAYGSSSYDTLYVKTFQKQ